MLLAAQLAKPIPNFTVVDRGDGMFQWAFKGKPLYYWKDDKKPGDVAGDNRGNVWASVVTGDPGFIETVDDRTLKIATPTSSGDLLGRNLATEGHVALFAPDFVSSRRVRVNGRGIVKEGAIFITPDEVYGNCRRYLQERIFVGSRQTHSANPTASVSTELSASQQEQIFRTDTFFIATDNPERDADVSHKGGNPGFVRTLDARHIAFPDYNGNSMFNTLGNVTVNPHAGLLFIDFDSGRTLQLTGRASIDWSPERVRTFPGAERVIDFELEQIIDTPAGFPLVAKFRQYSRNNPKL